jgi:hypothetical protein
LFLFFYTFISLSCYVSVWARAIVLFCSSGHGGCRYGALFLVGFGIHATNGVSNNCCSIVPGSSAWVYGSHRKVLLRRPITTKGSHFSRICGFATTEPSTLRSSYFTPQKLHPTHERVNRKKKRKRDENRKKKDPVARAHPPIIISTVLIAILPSKRFRPLAVQVCCIFLIVLKVNICRSCRSPSL